MPPIEVEDLVSDPNLAWVATMLTTAKKIMVDTGGNLQPMLFAETPAGFDICAFDIEGDFESPANKERWAFMMRRHLRERKATACAVVSDIWQRSVTITPEMEAQGYKVENYRSWPEALQRTHVVKREAIMALVETRTWEGLLVQFYRRERGAIIFEELKKEQAHEVRAGRLAGLLPRIQ